jgi:hypothetical protein
MSECCSIKHSGKPPICPISASKTYPVGRKTLEALLKPEAKVQLTNQPYYFCDAPDCDVVYVSALCDHLITKDMLKVRVGIKEKEDPIPLCYCFGYERKDIFEDIKNHGKTDIPKIIATRVRRGECHCEETNPSGGCCLGDIYRAVKKAKKL